MAINLKVNKWIYCFHSLTVRFGATLANEVWIVSLTYQDYIEMPNVINISIGLIIIDYLHYIRIRKQEHTMWDDCHDNRTHN